MVTIDSYHVESAREVVEAIGKVTIRWASFDNMLMQILSLVIDNRDLAVDLIFERAGAGNQRITAFQRAIGGSKLTQNEREELLQLTDRATKLQKKRNDIVHSPLVTTINFDGTNFIYETQKMSRNGNRVAFRLGDVLTHVDDIGDLLTQM